MHTEPKDVRKILVLLTALTIIGLAVAGVYPGSSVRGATSLPAPRVTSITQITHDGYRKASLLGDESALYVTEMPAANRVIARVSLPGSNRSVVPSLLSSPEALDLSPDRSKLLVSSTSASSGDREFWTLPLTSGSPSRVGDLTGRDASWSMDGKQLAFAKGAAVYVSSADGAQAHRVYMANGSVFGLRFSPDGQDIRFTVSNPEQNTTSLWEIGSDGSNPHALLGKWAYQSAACCGNWTADGRYYIFQASQTLPNTTTVVTSLWALPSTNADAPLPLTSGPASFGNPSPSPDNKKIWAIGVEPKVEIVKYEASKKKFVPVIPGLSATDLEYSPDGKWVVWVAIPEGTLWRSRANGTERLQLSRPPDQAALPQWSPDGKQIAFVSMKPGEPWKISLVPANGGEPQHILDENSSQIDANWSADGTRLMFASAAFQTQTQEMNIRILDFKTHKAEKIPGSDGLFSPRWSPDGRYVAALSPGNKALKLFDFETGKWSDWLTEPGGAVNYPVWSADSKYLYFDDFVNDEESIRRVKVGSSAVEQYFVLGSVERYLGPLGTWSGRAADGSWMFVRDRSTQEVYQLTVALQ